MFFGGKTSFLNSVENFVDNLRHFQEFFGVVFYTCYARVKNYTKKVEKMLKICLKIQDKLTPNFRKTKCVT